LGSEQRPTEVNAHIARAAWETHAARAIAGYCSGENAAGISNLFS
jgi:hypothetical protein